jgi:hypothetical protein
MFGQQEHSSSPQQHGAGAYPVVIPLLQHGRTRQQGAVLAIRRRIESFSHPGFPPTTLTPTQPPHATSHDKV